MNERKTDKQKKPAKTKTANKAKTVQRGRSQADLSPGMRDIEKGLVASSRDDAAHDSGRPKRVSMQNMKNLDIPAQFIKEGYFPYWFQDGNGRLSKAKAAYWEHIIDGHGNNFTCVSGSKTMYAMQLPQEYRDEDNALKRARVAATMDEESHIGANEYAPDAKTGKAEGGSSAVVHNTSEQ